MVAFILALLSIILSFFNILLGAIFAVIAIIVGKMESNKEEQYTKLSVVISAIVIVFNILILIYSTYSSINTSNAVSNIINNAREQVNREQAN